MEAVVCPYCEAIIHTSRPEVMAECPYCGLCFAEVHTLYERLTVLDKSIPDVWDKAEALMAKWQECGELDREVIVDRRLRDEEYEGPDRRRAAGLPVRLG